MSREFKITLLVITFIVISAFVLYAYFAPNDIQTNLTCNQIVYNENPDLEVYNAQKYPSTNSLIPFLSRNFKDECEMRQYKYWK